MNETLFVTLVISGSILGMAGFVVSLICVACVVGFTRSTHTVQYVPHDNTEAFKPDAEIVEENDKLLWDKVGKKPPKEKPTVVEDLDAPIDDINKSDIRF